MLCNNVQGERPFEWEKKWKERLRNNRTILRLSHDKWTSWYAQISIKWSINEKLENDYMIMITFVSDVCDNEKEGEVLVWDIDLMHTASAYA